MLFKVFKLAVWFLALSVAIMFGVLVGTDWNFPEAFSIASEVVIMFSCAVAALVSLLHIFDSIDDIIRHKNSRW